MTTKDNDDFISKISRAGMVRRITVEDFVHSEDATWFGVLKYLESLEHEATIMICDHLANLKITPC